MTLHQAISRQKRTGWPWRIWVLRGSWLVLVLSNADPPWVFLAIPGVVTFVAEPCICLSSCAVLTVEVGSDRSLAASGGPFSISPKFGSVRSAGRSGHRDRGSSCG